MKSVMMCYADEICVTDGETDEGNISVSIKWI